MNQEMERPLDDFSHINAKKVRKQKGINLQELSDKTDLSVAYLSKYENGKANITISALKRIANALEVTIADLLTETEERNILLVKSSERFKLVHHSGPNGNAYEEFITKGKSYNMTVVVLTLPANDCTEKENATTYTEECLFVLEGRLEVEYADQRIKLECGDSVYYDARVTHRWINDGETEVKFLLMQNPPSF